MQWKIIIFLNKSNGAKTFFVESVNSGTNKRVSVNDIEYESMINAAAANKIPKNALHDIINEKGTYLNKKIKYGVYSAFYVKKEIPPTTNNKLPVVVNDTYYSSIRMACIHYKITPYCMIIILNKFVGYEKYMIEYSIYSANYVDQSKAKVEKLKEYPCRISINNTPYLTINHTVKSLGISHNTLNGLLSGNGNNKRTITKHNLTEWSYINPTD